MMSEWKNERIDQRKKQADSMLLETQRKAEMDRVNIDKVLALVSVLETITIEPPDIPGGESKIKPALSPKDRATVRDKMFEIIDKL